MAAWPLSTIARLISVSSPSGTGIGSSQSIVSTDQGGQRPKDTNIRYHEPHHPYRVRGLPANAKPKTASRLLKSIFAEQSLGLRLRSLAQDPYTPFHSVATVTFEKRPDLLTPNKSEWRFPRSPKINSSDDEQLARDEEIIFDTHFHGFTALNSFDDKELHLMDVVAVCGLGGHAFCSFQERKGQYMWLRDGLPADTKANGVRVLTYGYDSQLLQSKSFQNIEDIASTFRKALSAMRRTDDNVMPRPLVFIAHSLGGIVLKEAIVQLDESDPVTFKSIIQCLFFGVPTQGMNVSTLYPIVKNQHNALTLLPYLAENSLWLKEQNRRFPEVFNFTDSNIIYFYETKESPTATEVDGEWKMRGETAVLVTTSSATYGRPWENDTRHCQALNRSHSDLVKFSSQDQDYHIVLEHLRESSLSAERVLRFRFPELVSGRESHSASPKAISRLIDGGYVLQTFSSRYIHKRTLIRFLDSLFPSGFKIQELNNVFEICIPRKLVRVSRSN